jgi:cyclic beta-1,2-glucan synthetase
VWAAAALGDGARAAAWMRLLNPIYHAATPEGTARYKVEPYVVAADVYRARGHVGRGGWTWYTGSAGWVYRLGVEALLGLRLAGDGFHLDPVIPADWAGFSLRLNWGGARYVIEVTNPDGVERGVAALTLDGAARADGRIPRLTDGGEHRVTVRLGEPVEAA